ncbi:hypothetical protein TYRP_006731 [Tyrophagus putrescentiae]|nr:hypothetical protein TYRP_006731 [Tyrophagus putrescentiae]
MLNIRASAAQICPAASRPDYITLRIKSLFASLAVTPQSLQFQQQQLLPFIVVAVVDILSLKLLPLKDLVKLSIPVPLVGAQLLLLSPLQQFISPKGSTSENFVFMLHYKVSVFLGLKQKYASNIFESCRYHSNYSSSSRITWQLV